MLINHIDREWFSLGRRQILIHPETGAWLVLDKCYKAVIPVMERSTCLDDVFVKFPELSPIEIADVLQALNENSLRILESNQICENRQKEESLPVLAVVKMAEGCNLNCSYCFIEASSDKKKKMNKETACRIFDEYLNIHANDNTKFNYCFHGGEPLLNLPVIRDVIEFIKPHRDRVVLSIQTNGTLITDEVARIFKENNFVVGVSIDGPKLFHDRVRTYGNGVGSFDKTMRGIEILRKNDIDFGIIAVLTGENTQHMSEVIDFFINNGIYDLSFSAVQKIGRGKNESYSILDGKMLFDAYKIILEKIVSHNKSHEKSEWLSERILTNLIKSIYFNKKPFMCMNAPCGAARLLLGFDVEGNFYACDNFTNNKEFLIGSLEKGGILNQLLGSEVRKKAAARCFNNLPRCKNCMWRGLCGGVCYSADYYSGANGVFETEMCSFYQKMIPYLISEIDKNPELPYYIDKDITNTPLRCFYITIDADPNNVIDPDLLEAIIQIHKISPECALYLCFNDINSSKNLAELLDLLDKKSLLYFVSPKENYTISFESYNQIANHKAVAFQMSLSDDISSLSSVKSFAEIRNDHNLKLNIQLVVPLDSDIWENGLIDLLQSDFILGDKVILQFDDESVCYSQLNALLKTLSIKGLDDRVLLPPIPAEKLGTSNLVYLSRFTEKNQEKLYIDINSLAGENKPLKS